MDKKPVLTWQEDLVWEVWSVLHSSRPIGMQASGIPISDIVALKSATTESEMDLVRLIKALDNHWFVWLDQQPKSK